MSQDRILKQAAQALIQVANQLHNAADSPLKDAASEAEDALQKVDMLLKNNVPGDQLANAQKSTQAALTFLKGLQRMVGQ